MSSATCALWTTLAPTTHPLQRDDAVPLLSIASVWEMAIKSSLGRVQLQEPLDRFLESKLSTNLQLLPLELEHVLAVERLSFHHQDPFDRVLVAQASAERIPIVTRDPAFRKYGVDVVWS